MPQGQEDAKAWGTVGGLLKPTEHSTVRPGGGEGGKLGRPELCSDDPLRQASQDLVWQRGHSELGPHQALELQYHPLHHGAGGVHGGVRVHMHAPQGMEPGEPKGGPQQAQARRRGVGRPGQRAVAKQECHITHRRAGALSDGRPQAAEPLPCRGIGRARHEDMGEAVPGCTAPRLCGAGRVGAQVSLGPLLLGCQIQATRQAAVVQPVCEPLGAVAGRTLPQLRPWTATGRRSGGSQRLRADSGIPCHWRRRGQRAKSELLWRWRGRRWRRRR